MILKYLKITECGIARLSGTFKTTAYTRDMRILIIEDEHRIASALKSGLQNESYAVDVEYDGSDGLGALRAHDYDLAIIDVMLPGINGYEIVGAMRAEKNHTPVLLLTAKSQNKDIIKGLDSGADDYLTKPFSFDVLLARVRALLRRPQDSIENTLQVADLRLDIVSKRVWRAKTELSLSSKEFAILEYMMRNPDKVLSKQNIISHVWDFDADVLPNTVEVFIAYLRAKVDKPFNEPNLIETVRGFGYRINSGVVYD